MNWGAQPETCIPCEDLRSAIQSFADERGEASLTDRDALATYLNSALFIERSADAYKGAMDSCRILNHNVAISRGTYADFGDQLQ